MISIPEELEQAATHIAELEGQPVEKWINDVVADAIDYYHDLQAIKEYEEEKANGTLVMYSLEEFKKRMDRLNALEN